MKIAYKEDCTQNSKDLKRFSPKFTENKRKKNQGKSNWKINQGEIGEKKNQPLLQRLGDNNCC